MSENPIAGWYADPAPGSTQLRYWDGNQWTGQFMEPPSNLGAGGAQASSVAAPVTQQVQSVQPIDQAGIPTHAQPVVQPVDPQSAQGYATQQQGYAQQPYVPPQQAQAYTYPQQATPQSNPRATAALIIGIAGCVLVGLVPSVIAIIFGVIGRKNPYRRGMATAGMVLGIIGAVISIFVLSSLFFV